MTEVLLAGEWCEIVEVIVQEGIANDSVLVLAVQEVLVGRCCNKMLRLDLQTVLQTTPKVRNSMLAAMGYSSEALVVEEEHS